MSAALVTQYAATNLLTVHSVPLTPKTVGRDLFMLSAASATVALPSPWVRVDSQLLGAGGFTINLDRLPAASNTAGVTAATVTLNGPESLAAIVWEDDLDTATAIYSSLQGNTPTGSNPALHGTGLHTFPGRDQAFAFFAVAANPAGAYDYASYDSGFAELGDSGLCVNHHQWRVWLAGKTSVSMTSNGVTATANGLAPGVAQCASGMIAYEVGTGAGVAPVNTVAPGITGTAQEASVMTCSTGTWTGTPTPTYAYQWTRNGVAISGATAATRTLATADVGQTIGCTVTASNATGSASAVSNTVTPSALGSGPANSVIPAITGSAVAGQTLTCSTGTWTGSPTPTYTFQWRRGATPISGATASTYLLVSGDVGNAITCTVTATNASGFASADSNSVTPTGAPAAPVNMVAPAVTGTQTTGSVVTSSSGTWSGSPAPSYAYQWKRGGTNIPGATLSTYVLAVADEGASLKCTVTATNATGSASADSNLISPSAPAVPSGIPDERQARLHRKRAGAWETVRVQAAGAGAVVARTPEEQGAKRDCKAFSQASITTGTPTLNVTDAVFGPGDVGKTVVVYGAGPAGNQNVLVSTISAVVNTTRVTLAANASATVSGKRGAYGTNDTAAINTAIALAVSDAQLSGGNYAEVQFSAGEYMVASAPVKGGVGKGNAQIQLPAIDPHLEKVVLVLSGGRDASALMHWQQLVPQRTGPVLRTVLAAQVADPTWGSPSVIGGQAPSWDWGYGTANFSNMLVVIDGLEILAPPNPSVVAVNLQRIAEANVKSFSAMADATPAEINATAFPTNDQGIGLYMPMMQNNDNCNLGIFSCEGFYYGLAFGDHLTAQRIACIYCNTAMFIAEFNTTRQHGGAILYASVEACPTLVECAGGSGGTFPIFIGMLNTETGGAATDYKDPLNNLRGVIYHNDITGVQPTIAGCTGVKIVNVDMKPGAVAAPTLPATTVQLVNPFFRDAAVAVRGGTVTGIAVDGVNVQNTSNTLVIVPSGKTIAVTYSSAPTWSWTLL